jgi:amino acid transporter
MPRSGGDYVWSGRILHPAIGTSLNLTFVIYLSLFVGSLANYCMSYGLSSTMISVGIISKNPALVSWGIAVFNNPLVILTLASIVILYSLVAQIRGLNFFLKQQLVLFAFCVFATVVTIAILLTTNPTQYAMAFDSGMSSYTTYQHIIDSAKSFGFVWAPTLSATLLALPFAWLTNNGYQYSGYFAGELKQVRKSMLWSTMGNNVISTILFATFAWAFVNAVGDNWLHSLAYLAYVQTSSFNFPVVPNPYFLASLATNNVVVAVIINLALPLWGPLIVASNWHPMTRTILGMGFDRVLPMKFADVSDRFHTPVVAIILVAIISWIGLVGSLYYGVIFGNMNFTLMYTIVMAIGGIAGVVYPLRKALYAKSPITGYKIGRIPLVSVLGVIVFVFFTYMAIAAGLNPSVGGPTNPYALTWLLITFVGCGVLYFISRAYHKAKHGIDIAANFAEIPPE